MHALFALPVLEHGRMDLLNATSAHLHVIPLKLLHQQACTGGGGAHGEGRCFSPLDKIDLLGETTPQVH